MPLQRSFLVLATLVVTCAGEDAGSSAPPPLPPLPPIPLQLPLVIPHSGSAWLGLGFSVHKPEASITAQIPALPPGIGFVVQAVSPGGPADHSQVHPKDILWKFSDQLLVNQGQLATLLNLKKPGEEVALAIFRDGKPVEIKVTLGEAPADNRDLSRDMVDVAILSDDGHPTRIIIPEKRTATFSDTDGGALIRREGDGYQVMIHGPDKQVIFEGKLTAEGNLDSIPTDWRRRIWVLRRSLDHALDSRMVPVRAPRPRVVTPTTPAPNPQPSPIEPPKL